MAKSPVPPRITASTSPSPLSGNLRFQSYTSGSYDDNDAHFQGRLPVQTWASLSTPLLRPLPPSPLLQPAHLLLPLRLQPHLEPRQHQPQRQRTHVRPRIRWCQWKNDPDIQLDSRVPSEREVWRLPRVRGVRGELRVIILPSQMDVAPWGYKWDWIAGLSNGYIWSTLWC